MAVCPNGHEVPDEQRFCGVCGIATSPIAATGDSVAHAASQRRTIGIALIVVALGLGVWGWVNWENESDRAEHQARVDEFTVALQDGIVTEQEPDADRTAPIAMWAVGSLLFIAGVITVVSTPPQPRPTSRNEPESFG